MASIEGVAEACGHELRHVPQLPIRKLPVQDWVLSKVQDALGSTPRDLQPLQLWTAEDADESVEGTVRLLMEYEMHSALGIGLQELKTKTERPTPQFVWRVAWAIHEATGLLPDLPEEWPEELEAKLDVFWHLRVRVASRLHMRGVDVIPTEILKCRQREKTRWLLQLLAIAGAKEALAAELGFPCSPMSCATSMGDSLSALSTARSGASSMCDSSAPTAASSSAALAAPLPPPPPRLKVAASIAELDTVGATFSVANEDIMSPSCTTPTELMPPPRRRFSTGGA